MNFRVIMSVVTLINIIYKMISMRMITMTVD